MPTARDGEAADRREPARRSERARSGERREAGRGEREPSRRERPGLRASEVAQAAVREISELTGRRVEGVTSVQRGEEGWRVGVEVVETHRVPETSDVLAVYETDLDPSGELLGYQRVERYVRGRSSER